MNGRPSIDRSIRFLSGQWTGYFLQRTVSRRTRTDMDLTFLDGRIIGDGVDEVGPFTIEGWYEPATGDCEWMKEYVGKHAVRYHGKHDEDGIWGMWVVNSYFGLKGRGGFHIWPEVMPPAEDGRVEKALLQAMQNESSDTNYGRSTTKLRFPTTVILVILKLLILSGLLFRWIFQ